MAESWLSWGVFLILNIENNGCYCFFDANDGRAWMEGPMSNVNPDQVDQDVGNLWRLLYKLEKGFEGVAAPKKIAAKVLKVHDNYLRLSHL